MAAVAYASDECFGFVRRPTAGGSRADAARRALDARRAEVRMGPDVGVRPHRLVSPSAATFRRRRMVTLAVLVAATAVIVGLVLCGPLSGPGDGSLTVTGPTGDLISQNAVANVHIVQPGETLWSIVRSSGVTGDPRPVIDRLEAQLNHQPLQAGQRLVMP